MGTYLYDPLLRIGVFLAELLLTFTLVYWMRRSARGRQEPWQFVFTILAYGAATALISAIIEIRYSFDLPALQASAPQLVAKYGTWYQFINNLSAATVEELAKYMVAVFTVVNTKHFHKLTDSIIYLILIGLGFSLVEDIFFLLNPETYAPYRLLSFYVHSGTSAIVGYSMGRYKFGLAPYRELLWSVLGAISLHLAYNLSTTLVDSDTSFYLTAAITAYITLQVFILFRKALAEEYKLEKQESPLEGSRLLNLKR